MKKTILLFFGFFYFGFSSFAQDLQIKGKIIDESAPSGHTGVNWLHSSITTTITTYYAIGFQPGKSELLPLPQASVDANPNLKQDYGY